MDSSQGYRPRVWASTGGSARAPRIGMMETRSWVRQVNSVTAHTYTPVLVSSHSTRVCCVPSSEKFDDDEDDALAMPMVGAQRRAP